MAADVEAAAAVADGVVLVGLGDVEVEDVRDDEDVVEVIDELDVDVAVLDASDANIDVTSV